MMLKALLMSSRLGLGQSFIHHNRHHNYDDASDVEHLAHNIGTWEVQGTFHLSSFTPFPIATSWLEPDSTLCSISNPPGQVHECREREVQRRFPLRVVHLQSWGSGRLLQGFLFLCKLWKEFLLGIISLQKIKKNSIKISFTFRVSTPPASASCPGTSASGFPLSKSRRPPMHIMQSDSTVQVERNHSVWFRVLC